MRQTLPLIIFGTSGAARELYYLIKQVNEAQNYEMYHILGFISENETEKGMVVCDNTFCVSSDYELENYLKPYDQVAAVIQFGSPKIKKSVVEKVMKCNKLQFPNIIHPSVIFEKSLLHLGKGNIIAAQTVLGSDCHLGNFNLINRSCTIGHDFYAEDYNTINPGSIVSGCVKISNGCLIGAGSIILENLSLNNEVTIGAGALLTHSVKKEKSVMIGVPAREMIRNE